MPPLVDIRGLDKRFFGVTVLKGVHLQLMPGRVLGLVGENGAGKSTLLNILGGIIQSDGGIMELEGRPYRPRNPRDAGQQGVALVHQELNLFRNLSVAENIFLTDFPGRPLVRRWWINRRALKRRTQILLESLRLDLNPNAPLEQLSPGQRQLVEIAKALQQRSRLVIFDEPTTSLTQPEIEQLFGIIDRLRKQGLAIIYVSHNLGDVLRLCDDVAVLRDGEVQAVGPREEFNVERIIMLMVGRRIEQLFPKRSSRVEGEPALEVEGLSQPGVVQNVSFRLHGGEIVGLAGLMGAGRTELVRILFGLDPYRRGTIRIGGKTLQQLSPLRAIRHGMVLLTENRREEGLLLDADIVDNVVLASLRRFVHLPSGWLQTRRARAAAAEVAQSLSIDCRSIEGQAVRTLSGGNQQKVVLAKWLMVRPRIFLLDEPTRGVDVGAKAEIYQLIQQLAAEGAAILLISSEMEELLGTCDRILVMSRGRISGSLVAGDFDREQIMRMAFGKERLQ